MAANTSEPGLFLRNAKLLDFMGKEYARWLKDGQLRFRFWVAGAEPYSMAMTLCEAAGTQKSDTKILVTHTNRQALKEYKKGLYPAAMGETSHCRLEKYGEPTRESDGAFFKMNSTIKALLAFRPIDLANAPYPMRGPIDAIVYAGGLETLETQAFFDEASRILKPGGHLVLDGPMGRPPERTDLQCAKSSIYTKPAGVDSTPREQFGVFTPGRRGAEADRRHEPRESDRRTLRRRTDSTVIDGLKQVYVMAGDIGVSAEPCLFRTILGSCIAVCLHDLKRGWGGMNHIMHAGVSFHDPNDAKWSQPAIHALIQGMLGLGSRPGDLTAQVIGGGHVLETVTRRIGDTNASETLAELRRLGIRVHTTDIGGNSKRKVQFHSQTGDLRIL